MILVKTCTITQKYKYFTIKEFNKFTADYFSAKLTQEN